jgi:uroporphyrinogen III methyltransferase/synthase
LTNGGRSLEGLRVLVTRAAGDAAATSEALAARGAIAVCVPVIATEPPPEPELLARAASRVRSYDLVLFTSETAVERFVAAVEGADPAHRDGAAALEGVRVGAVGLATARALAARGLRVDVVPSEFRGDALAEAVLAQPWFRERLAAGAARVLVPRALVGREELPTRLREAGAQVDVVPAYQVVPARAEAEPLSRALDAGELDAVLLFSPSAAENLVALVGAHPSRWARTLVASIGPVTTRAAEALGLPVMVTATESTQEGLFDALARAVATRRSA